MKLQHADQAGRSLYLLCYSDDGDQVWSVGDGGFVVYEDEDDPSSSIDPWDYAISLEESGVRLGWYSADVSFNFTGWLRYEVWEELGSDPQNTDYRRAISSVYLVDGSPYLWEGQRDAIAEATAEAGGTARLSKQDRRRIARAAQRSQERRPR